MNIGGRQKIRLRVVGSNVELRSWRRPRCALTEAEMAKSSWRRYHGYGNRGAREYQIQKISKWGTGDLGADKAKINWRGRGAGEKSAGPVE